MTTIDALISSTRQLPIIPLEQKNSTSRVPEVSSAKPSSGTPVEGVKVSLSGVGLQKAAQDRTANANKNIEESGLPN